MSHAASPPLAGRRLRHRSYLGYAAIVGAAVVTSLALADSVNPLEGIGVAHHPRTPADALEAGVQAQLRADLVPPGGVDQIGGRLTGLSRLVGALPSGKRVYVVPTTKGRLCVVLAGSAESCGFPLTQDEPVTFTIVWDGPGDRGYAYGVARDGVQSVSFTAGAQRVTVPVEDNFFAYETEPRNTAPGFGALSVTLADGTTQPVG